MSGVTPAFLLALREGIEAALIVGIIVGYLIKTNNERFNRPVWLGVLAAVAASLGAAALFEFVASGLEEEPLFEGIVALLAAAVLTSMIFWMRNAAREVSARLGAKVERAISRGEVFGLTALAFVAVFREGVELVLFLGGAATQATGDGILLGGGLGLAVAAILGYLMLRSSVRLNLRRFFVITGVFLILFAAGLAAKGVAEVTEAAVDGGLLSSSAERPLWNFYPNVAEDAASYPLLHDHGAVGGLLAALFGYDSDPLLSQVVAYILYWAFIAGVVFRDVTVAWLRRSVGRVLG